MASKKDSSLIKKESLGKTSEVRLLFRVPAAELEKFLDEAAHQLSHDIKIDGFRHGKVPREVIEGKVGAERLLNEAANLAVRKHYVDAILDEKIQAIGEPKIEIKKLAKGNDLEFTATVGLLPEIKLENWQAAIKKVNREQKDKKVEVDDKEVERELEFLANQRAKVVTVNREAKQGDQVEVDFQVFQDNVAIEGGTAQKHPVVIGENKFIPGFEEKLVGAKAGEEKEFELKFPEKYHAPNLAGKKAKFKVKVNLVQERQVAKIDDEFAKGIGKFKSLAELKDNIKHGIEHEKKHKLEEEHKKELIEALVEKVDAQMPGSLVEREVMTMMNEMDQDIARVGLTREKYLAQLKTTEEKLKKEWSENQAPKRVKAALILRHLAQENKLEPDSKKVEERVNQILQYYQTIGQAKDKIDLPRLYEATKGNLANELVFEFLMKIK